MTGVRPSRSTHCACGQFSDAQHRPHRSVIDGPGNAAIGFIRILIRLERASTLLVASKLIKPVRPTAAVKNTATKNAITALFQYLQTKNKKGAKALHETYVLLWRTLSENKKPQWCPTAVFCLKPDQDSEEIHSAPASSQPTISPRMRFLSSLPTLVFGISATTAI